MFAALCKNCYIIYNYTHFLMFLLTQEIVVSAQALEDVMTLYFSHPAVEGILLWGFWNGKIFTENASLVEGPDLTVRNSFHLKGKL